MTLFRRVIANVSGKVRSHQSGWAPNPASLVFLYEDCHVKTDTGTTPRDNKSRDCGNAVASPGTRFPHKIFHPNGGAISWEVPYAILSVKGLSEQNIAQGPRANKWPEPRSVLSTPKEPASAHAGCGNCGHFPCRIADSRYLLEIRKKVLSKNDSILTLGIFGR